MITVGKTYEYSYGEYKAYAIIRILFETVVEKNGVNVKPVNKFKDSRNNDINSIQTATMKTYGAVANSVSNVNTVVTSETQFIIPDIDYFEWKEIESIHVINRQINPNFLLYKKDKKYTNLEIGENTFTCGNIKYIINIKKFFKINNSFQYQYFKNQNQTNKKRHNTAYGCIGDIYRIPDVGHKPDVGYKNRSLLKENAFIPDIHYYVWKKIKPLRIHVPGKLETPEIVPPLRIHVPGELPETPETDTEIKTPLRIHVPGKSETEYGLHIQMVRSPKKTPEKTPERTVTMHLK